MIEKKNNTEIVQHLETLYSAVVCDILDGIGCRDQILNRHIRPLTHVTKICGRVKTAQAVPVTEVPEHPYELEMKMMDEVEAGEVICIDAGSNETNGLWGELMTTAAVYRGCRGVVMSACSRDLWAIEDTEFPVFGLGTHPADSKGRVDIVSLGEPIKLTGVTAEDGDFIIGDRDGTVVIPGKIIDEVIRNALEKVLGENVARNDLRDGVPISVVFERYGIL